MLHIVYKIQNMSRCAWCRKKTHLDIACKWCSKIHCTTCLLAESHACPNMSDMKNEQHSLLTNKLMHEKVVKSKVLKI